MSTEPPQASLNASLSIPGKIFLIGEYAVLEGEPAWVAAVPPRFRWNLGPAGGKPAGFHPDSAAAKFVRSVGRASTPGTFVDAWEGQGGFGGSTAEFAIAAYLAGVRDPLEAHRKYRDLHREHRPLDRANSGPLPSGADLVAQWVGGAIEWTPDDQGSGSFRSIENELCGLPFLFFSATHLPDRKTKTHAHLEALAEKPIEGARFATLSPVIELARSALAEKDLLTLGTAFTRYAEALHELGLEAESAHADRSALAELPGVIGVKGCGALQTDAIVLLVEDAKDEAVIESVIGFAEATLGLRLLSRGLPREPGIREET
jgi:mevalonate kinase